MKRDRIFAAALALALTLTACGGGSGSSSSSPSSSSSTSPSSSSSQSASAAPADTTAILDSIYKDLEIIGVMDVDQTAMTDLVGIPAEYYDSYGARYSLARFNIGDVFLIKPSSKEGSAQFIKDKLEEYRKSKEEQFQNYNVGGDYEKAQNAQIFERGGYVVLLMLEDNAPAKTIVEEKLPE